MVVDHRHHHQHHHQHHHPFPWLVHSQEKAQSQRTLEMDTDTMAKLMTRAQKLSALVMSRTVERFSKPSVA